MEGGHVEMDFVINEELPNRGGLRMTPTRAYNPTTTKEQYLEIIDSLPTYLKAKVENLYKIDFQLFNFKSYLS